MAAFRGFAATCKGTPCYVINEDSVRYKVTLGTYHGYAGDHAVRQVVSYTGKTGWVLKDTITRVTR